jgi:pimeloyl-ACP methyl ester carboxylesterase
VRYRDKTVLRATEFSRGIDYLFTRGDIDTSRIAYVGLSWGACDGPIFVAVEQRYRSAILIGGGSDEFDLLKLPEANPLNFAPFIGCPVILLNGKYDEATPYEASGRALYDLLSEPKKLALLESGHCPPPEVRVPVIEEWLDETLGPVKHQQN